MEGLGPDTKHDYAEPELVSEAGPRPSTPITNQLIVLALQSHSMHSPGLPSTLTASNR